MGHESRLIAVKELPQWLQRGLRSAGYGTAASIPDGVL